ncbi:outer membrane protein [Ruegeria sp. EL01]|jgi:hypothetical protein|uniref:outer membrane protein n=1 Tax=Ruegeria sp. EL01 TaxID=2107578 RepID=UPI000EA8189D|nr:outer membrane beta-barrel protein [Ruegeria sp. EL01]
MNKHTPFALFATVAIAVLTTTSLANANELRDGFYGGIAIVGSAGLTEEGGGVQERDTSDGNIGIFVGYKQNVYKNWFVGGEAFYNETSQSKTFSNGDKLSFGDQYGVKAHLGYEWKRASVYAIVGATNFDYDISLAGVQRSESDFSPLFGIGSTYQISDQFSANLEYTATGDTIDIAGDSDRGIGMGVFRLGLAYHF